MPSHDNSLIAPLFLCAFNAVDHRPSLREPRVPAQLPPQSSHFGSLPATNRNFFPAIRVHWRPFAVPLFRIPHWPDFRGFIANGK
jgi:hypothetical protein